MTLDERLVQITPHARQVAFQSMEFYAFVHFTINTYTDKEWGDGTEPPMIFDPRFLDAEQWVKSICSAGMRGLILTCKHHDGFCLWPSRYTKHTVEYSPYKKGKGDIVREVADACKKYDIKFGIYLSPWDRNCQLYGQGKAYDDYFVGQLTELLTNYGEIFTCWLDGACGEGPNGKRQNYDWERYYEVIRRLQPNACINVSGPDIRWCGNEAGKTRPAEWSVVPARTKDCETIAKNSQQADDTEFRTRSISSCDKDLGSRRLLENEYDLIWYPAEVNTSIRPGWFWHESENDSVRSAEELFDIYINSVGGNSTFLLNIPPSKDGRFHENDVKVLEELGSKIRELYSNDVLSGARIYSDSCEEINSVRIDSYDDYYIAEQGHSHDVITVEWDNPVDVGCIVIKENILLSQRVESFTVEARINGIFSEIYRGTVIGYKRIIPFNVIRTDCIRLNITDSRTEPTVAFLGIYGSN